MHGLYSSVRTGAGAKNPGLPRTLRSRFGRYSHNRVDSDPLRLIVYRLWLAFVVGLAGCAYTPPQVVEPPVPTYRTRPEVWRAIDARIAAVSVSARRESEAYARLAMEEWRMRVRQRTEDVFIPWYTSYWTQQLIATKVTWYELQYAEGEATPEDRLAGYLQEQFYTQVLKPVSGFVDPLVVMQDTADGYLSQLSGQLDLIRAEYRIPADAFNRHLDTIPAIVVAVTPAQVASLHEVLQAADPSSLPPYAALLTKMAAVNGATDQVPSADRLQAVAGRAVAKLVGTLALRGGATAASTLVGGFWGVLISMGSAAWSAMEYDQDKPEMQAQLEENLDAALELMWQDLVEDQRGGVTALVAHMDEQIQSALRPAVE